MYRANFCSECGEHLSHKGWPAWLGRRLCAHCSRRLGGTTAYRSLIVVGMIGVGAFVVGRYVRPAPPPLIIQRAANSPLPGARDENASTTGRTNASIAKSDVTVAAPDDEAYICGARTKKGAPCRRRVHAAGQRCFQHKGMPAMVAPDKLIIKPTSQSK